MCTAYQRAIGDSFLFCCQFEFVSKNYICHRRYKYLWSYITIKSIKILLLWNITLTVTWYRKPKSWRGKVPPLTATSNLFHTGNTFRSTPKWTSSDPSKTSNLIYFSSKFWAVPIYNIMLGDGDKSVHSKKVSVSTRLRDQNMARGRMNSSSWEEFSKVHFGVRRKVYFYSLLFLMALSYCKTNNAQMPTW